MNSTEDESWESQRKARIAAKKAEGIRVWRDRVAVALERVFEGESPRDVHAGATVLCEFFDRGDGEEVEAFISSRRTDLEDRFLELAGSTNKFFASVGLGALARMKSSKGHDLALEAMLSDNDYIRESGVRLFAVTAEQDNLDQLELYVRDPAEAVALAAIRGIEERSWRQALPLLLAELNQLRESIRHTFGTQPVRSTRSRVLLRTVSKFLGEEAVPLLLEVARNNVTMRSYAVTLLSFIDPDAAAPLLIELLSDPSESLRIGVLKLIWKANYRKALPVIRPLLQDSNGPVRAQAFNIVESWHDSDSAPAVRLMAQRDNDPILRVRAISLLAVLEPEGWEDDLIGFLEDTNRSVQAAALKALAEKSHVSAGVLHAINHLAESAADTGVRLLASSALSKLGIRSIEPLAGDQPPLLLSSDLLAELPILEDLLTRWRKGLIELTREYDLETVGQLDAALGLLTDAVIRARQSIDDPPQIEKS